MDKQIILFIVEGMSEQTCFENILNQLDSNKKNKFKIIRGDITAKSCQYNIVKNISKKVIEFLEEPQNKHYELKNIKKVVHLIDTDGVFMLDSCIVKNDEDEKIFSGQQYKVPNIKGIIVRNKNKRDVLKKIANTNFVSIGKEKVLLQYECYYFSCNLEHVLHNNPNVQTDNEKKKLANSFADQYFGYEYMFLDFIKDKSFATNLCYQDSWNYIMRPENAFNRKTNFNLYFIKDD
ncbi:MAG: hypothetical protein PHS54_05335 [Clostridia bacterium]|nr:hypothetical protein [Clostridia bacterium]